MVGSVGESVPNLHGLCQYGLSSGHCQMVHVWAHFADTLRMRKEWYFASERANFIILSQTSAVACAILDRTHVVSGGCDNVVIIWERYDAKLLQRLVGHSGHIGALHMNSRLIASGSADRSIRLWSRADGQCLRVFEGHRSNVVCLQFDDHKLVSGSADQTIRVVGRMDVLFVPSIVF